MNGFQNRSNIARLLLLLLSAFVSGCGSSSAPSESGGTADSPDVAGSSSSLQAVSLQLNWFPEVEHGGYYAAKVHGFFEEEGLDVEIIPGGPNRPIVQSVATGRRDFAVTNADRVLFGHEAGAKVVALMAPIQHTPRCVMVHEESGITKLEDLKDITLAIGTGPAFYQFMQKRLPMEGVRTVAYPGSIGTFVSKKQFAQQAYVFSEPFLAKQQGAKPRALMLSDIGYDPYASVLVASPKLLVGERASIAERLVRASVRGWRKYLDSPDETNKLILSLNDAMTAEALAYGVKEVAKLCAVDDEADFGKMNEQRWQTLIDQLAEIELVDREKVQAASVFDLRGFE